MKKKETIIMIILFFVGLIILLYPFVSDWYNKKVQAKAIGDYEQIIQNYEEKDYSSFFEEASKYNKKLNKLSNPYVMHYTIKNYNKVLNTDGNGMIGYITIDKIKVKLPIYHGTDESVLGIAVGHLEGSSLPVGGENTHSVLSAHRGLPSSKLFTNLDKLEIGDTFEITVLNQKLTYQVDKIEIVKPSNTKSLKVVKGKDYVTLMTCTPYGINSHRLLVRASRIENIENLNITSEAYKINNAKVSLIMAVPLVIIAITVVALKPAKKSKEDLIDEFVYNINK